MKARKRFAEFAIAFLIAAVFTGLTMMMTGCSTVRGFGHLINGIGDDIGTASDGAKEYMTTH